MKMKIKFKLLTILFAFAVGLTFFGWGVKDAYAATFTITTDSPVTYTIRILYNSNCPATSVLHNDQTIHNGGTLSYSGFPDGCYTWEITTWPSGYDLAGIDGAGHQSGGDVSWNTRWTPSGYNLSVSKSGTGSGTVTGTGINCGGDCSETYPAGQCHEYSHSEDSGSTWGGWSGACTGPGCVICFDSNKSLTATFNAAPPPPPSVSVSVTPATVNQGENVTVNWSVSGQVTGCWATGNWPGWQGYIGTTGYSSTTVGGLTDNPTTFGVRCDGPGGTDSKEQSVTVIKRYTLNVSKSGSGSGTVTGNNGINCGNTCSTVYNSGNMVGLDAVPNSGSTFAGWSAPCSGTGGCVFQITSNQTVTATFNTIPKYTLTVTKSGTGSGTVTGSGINCGSDCSETYNSGACIEYFHSETKGSKWGGWSGACDGPGCIICYNSNKSLTATFTKKEPTVSISCSPDTIPYNSSANVSWSSKDTSNCTVSPTGWTGKSGSQSTGNLTSSQTYTVTCTGE